MTENFELVTITSIILILTFMSFTPLIYLKYFKDLNNNIEIYNNICNNKSNVYTNEVKIKNTYMWNISNVFFDFNILEKYFHGKTASKNTDKKEINRFIDQYSGAGFDGMIDYKFYKDIWITPDGLVEQAKSEGSACTGGCYEKYSYKPTNPDSILVSSGAWVSFVASPKYGTKPCQAYTEYCKKKYNQQEAA